MKKRTLQGGDSYPGRLAGEKRRPVEKPSVQFCSEVRRIQETILD
jgi:hypothetical protein